MSRIAFIILSFVNLSTVRAETSPEVEVHPLKKTSLAEGFKSKGTHLNSYREDAPRALPFSPALRNQILQEAQVPTAVFDEFQKDELLLRALHLKQNEIIKIYPQVLPSIIQKLRELSLEKIHE